MLAPQHQRKELRWSMFSPGSPSNQSNAALLFLLYKPTPSGPAHGDVQASPSVSSLCSIASLALNISNKSQSLHI